MNPTARPLTMLLLAVGLFFGLTGPSPALAGDAARAKAPLFVPGELLVKFKSGATRATRANARKTVNGQLIRTLRRLDVEHWRLPQGVSVSKAAADLRAGGQVVYAEPNARRYRRLLPNDPEFGRQWGLDNTGQAIGGAGNDPVASVLSGTPGADMQLPAAWNVTTGLTTVAVIDDSVDIAHPDLAANIRINLAEQGGVTGFDDDFNGQVDDITGWDFVNNDADPSGDGTLPNKAPPSGEGHGTLVAGSLGAVGNNGIGVAGVAWNVGIIPIKFGFTVASQVLAINYAIDQNAKIVNASWGGPMFSQTASDAVDLLRQNNILLVVAAGNSGLDHDLFADFPGDHLPGDQILTVSATGPTDSLDWSDFGHTTVDVAAPGESVYTTMPLNNSVSFGNTRTVGVDYDYTQGTSFSSPYTAGIAALVESQFPNSGYADLKGRIMAGVEPLNAQTGMLATDGRVNALNSLTMAPEPVLTIKSVRVDDSATGNNDGVIDPGESVDLTLTLENAWQAASGISATLTSSHPDVTVNTGSATFIDLAQGVSGGVAAGVIPLSITLAASAITGDRLPFTLLLTATGGYTVTRTFFVDVANPLSDGSIVTATLGTDITDTVDHYTFILPAGASKLTVTTTASGGEDLAVIVSDTLPAVLGGSGETAMGDTTFGGNEQATINAPTASLYHVLVHSFAFPNRTFSYTVMASTTAASTANPLVPGINIYTIVAGGNVVFSFADLLANDAGGPPLTITQIDPVSTAGGTVVLTDPATNTYTYTPLAGFLGEDRFTYSLTDGTSTKIGVVSVRVTTATSLPNSVNNAGGCQVGAAGEAGMLLPLMLLAALAHLARRRRH